MAEGGSGGGSGGDSGGGGGRGRGGANRDRAAAVPVDFVQAHFTTRAFHPEAYHGEDEDVRYLATLLSEPELPHPPFDDDIHTLAPVPASTLPDSNTEALNVDIASEPAPIDFFAEIAEADDEDVPPLNLTATAEDVLTEVVDPIGALIRTKVTHQQQIIMVPVPMAPNIPVEIAEQEHHEDQNLELLLQEGLWEDALLRLTHMVRLGEAENGAVENSPPQDDIFKAHPELALRLRGQTFVDMLQQGHTASAEIYYRGQIASLYPQDITGSPFVDMTLMRSLKELARNGLPSGDHAIFNHEETCKCIQDYLKIYFPMYRPIVRARASQVWEFGESIGDKTRCCVCHKEIRGSNLWKLRAHLLSEGKGKQGRCKALTSYIRRRLEEILANEGFNPDGTQVRAQAASANSAGPSTSTTPPLPPSPAPPDDDDDRGPTSTPPVPPPPPDE